MTVDREVKCTYLNECMDARTMKCFKCKNNVYRHKAFSCYIEAHDNPIPSPNPKVSFTGLEEHTAGYKCPVCGEFTNPYAMNNDHLCNGCGFKLNIG